MDSAADHAKASKKYKLLLTLGALGVVYGDIGTSPLYALKEAFHHGHIDPSPGHIFGILSLVFWSLILVISLKYLVFILRADYNKEGGILALTSLIDSNKNIGPQLKIGAVLLGIFGAAFLYGDGIITPAISILSAVEGLKVITPVFENYVVPITVIILIILFSIQKRGTGSIGKIFGPVTLTWFLVIGALGLNSIMQNPGILSAANPYHAFAFFSTDPFAAFVVLGSVFLVVTGGEALYSDLGHFGIKPIRRAWFFVVLPCLLLNYFGQGAFLLQNPDGVGNPFFLMAPSWCLYPLVGLATLATTIASQALITGVFSISMQAVQHGYMPRFLISHTSESEFGQIYIKRINFALMIGCIMLVLIFRTSGALAAAYGLAVTATMIITTILFYLVAVYRWRWNKYRTFALCAVFGVIDLAFLSSNLLKIMDGGWFPLLLGLFVFIYMTTWKKGRRILSMRLKNKSMPLEAFNQRIEHEKPFRTDGTGVFMNRSLSRTPIALVQTYNHFKTIHKNIVIISVEINHVPRLNDQERFKLSQLENGFYILKICYGFLESPDIPYVFELLKPMNPIFDVEKVSFFIGRENIFASKLPGMAIWRERLFAIMSKNEMPATQYFNLPRHRVIEIGTQISI